MMEPPATQREHHGDEPGTPGPDDVASLASLDVALTIARRRAGRPFGARAWERVAALELAKRLVLDRVDERTPGLVLAAARRAAAPSDERPAGEAADLGVIDLRDANVWVESDEDPATFVPARVRER